MNPKFIAEVWQAMSVLSDAQEYLGDETFPALDLSTRVTRANQRINHAKAHLHQFLDWAMKEHQPDFIQGTLVLECTISGDAEVSTDGTGA
jgi:hypothetical protein